MRQDVEAIKEEIKGSRIKSDNINNDNKGSLIDGTIVIHDNINYNKISKNIDINCYV